MKHKLSTPVRLLFSQSESRSSISIIAQGEGPCPSPRGRLSRHTHTLLAKVAMEFWGDAESAAAAGFLALGTLPACRGHRAVVPHIADSFSFLGAMCFTMPLS